MNTRRLTEEDVMGAMCQCGQPEIDGFHSTAGCEHDEVIDHPMDGGMFESLSAPAGSLLWEEGATVAPPELPARGIHRIPGDFDYDPVPAPAERSPFLLAQAEKLTPKQWLDEMNRLAVRLKQVGHENDLAALMAHAAIYPVKPL